jgi:quercetin dioxygenase-like cupin family protein
VECETYELEEGDAIYFKGATLRRIAARGEKTVRYLSVITPPIF